MQTCAPLCQPIAGACRWWAAISVLPRAKLVGVVAASVCARVRRGRGPPHVRAFSCLRIDNYFAIVTRELAAAPSCQRIAGFTAALAFVTPLGSNVRRGPDYVRRLRALVRKCGGPRLQTPFSYRFTRPMSWSVYPTNEGSLTYELAEESVVTRRCPGLFISQQFGMSRVVQRVRMCGTRMGGVPISAAL